MDLKELAFWEGIPFEIYNKNAQKWDEILTNLYLIFYLTEILRERDYNESIGKILNRFTSYLYKVREIIQLMVYSHLKLSKTFVDQNMYLYGNDYNSHLNVLLNYAPGSGGNFLRNCLNCSDDISSVYFEYCIGKMDINEIISNLENIKSINNLNKLFKTDNLKNFYKSVDLNNLQEKINYLISKTTSQNIWIDPNLNLKMKPLGQYNYNIHANHSSLDKIINEDLKIWPNTKTIIFFKNTKLFSELRFYPKWFWHGSKYDNFTKPPLQKTLLEFIELPQKDKKNIMSKLNDEIQINSVCSLDSKKTLYIWDTNWYFSEKDTITHIKELYEILSLSGFNEDAISKYYNVWIKTMSDLKNKALNEVTK